MSDKRRFQAWCGLSVLVALTFIGLAVSQALAPVGDSGL